MPAANAFKMSSAARKPFSYIFIGEANKNIDQAKDVRAQAPYLRHVHAACGIEHFCRK